MKFLLFSISLSLLNLSAMYARANKIIIEVTSDKAFKESNYEVSIMFDLDELRFTGKYENFKFVKKNSFFYALSIPTDGPVYISKFSKLPFPTKLSCILLPGDSIRIRMVNGKPQFSGQGAEVLSCLNEISVEWSGYNQDSLVRYSLEKPESERAFWKFTDSFGGNFISFYKILEKYRGRLSPISYVQLKAELMAGMQSSLGILVGNLSYYRNELGLSGKQLTDIYDEIIRRYGDIVCHPVDTLGITTSIYGLAPFSRISYLRSLNFKDEGDWLDSWIGTYYYSKANFTGAVLRKLLTEIVCLYLIRESPGDDIAYGPIKDFMSLPGHEEYRKKANDLFFSKFRVAFTDIGSDGKFVDQSIYRDGPYVFRCNGYTFMKNVNVINNVVAVRTDTINEDIAIPVLAGEGEDRKLFNVKMKKKLEMERSVYEPPSELLAISDIEGNFNAFAGLLQNNDVVDENLNWSFGSGHLVLIGDFVDRGTEVTQVLWLIYSLEEQARNSGGYVHLILGNHEIMNLGNFTSYVHKKYLDNAKLLNEDYSGGLYGVNSEIGKWLRTKNVVEKVGDILFTHAGISFEVNNLSKSIEQINELARQHYGGALKKEYTNSNVNTIMSPSIGPFWYRGYYGKYKNATTRQIDSTLQKFGVKRIVTGHTIINKGEAITTHYNGKVINIDTYHAGGRSEALLVKRDIYYRVNNHGKRVLLFSNESKELARERETE